MSSDVSSPSSPLVERSISLIRDLQTSEGAYPACPTFSAYLGFSWFRDGAFIADGMSAVGQKDSAEEFFNWCAAVMEANAQRISHIVERSKQGAPVPGEQMLPTRFRFDGSPAKDGWEDFQLDGYGTWLWALAQHSERHGTNPLRYAAAVQLTADYLISSWDRHCYDWWEEHQEQVHISTLGCILAGLRGALQLNVLSQNSAAEVNRVLPLIDRMIRDKGVQDGHLTKWIGTDNVDASLSSLVAPLGVIAPADPLAANTISAIENQITTDLGVHRFAADTFFGGGQWPLLSCFVGLAQNTLGNPGKAREYLEWAASTVTEQGHLPEQVDWDLLDPNYLQYWENKWGPSASPLLWSHAMYLRLWKELS